MFNNDNILEIMKYLTPISLLRISTTNKENYLLLDNFINNIDQENFYIENNIKIVNRSYELFPKHIINIHEFMEPIKFKPKNKKEYVLFVIDNVRIKIYKNRIKISGNKLLKELIEILSNLLKFKVSKNNLINISTRIKLRKIYNSTNIKYDYIKINSGSKHLTAKTFDLNIHNSKINYLSHYNNNYIYCTYNKFKIFYLTYNWL